MTDDKIEKKYYCECCNYYVNRKSSYDKHLKTMKHQELSNNLSFECNNCKKIFNSRVGLWKHIKKCKTNTSLIQKTNEPLNENAIMSLLNDNMEVKKILLSIIQNGVQNIQQTTINNAYNNINSNNKQFNLQFFLNETCKDAMNITDFVSSIKLSLEDLETTGEKGYVEGITNIFIKNLNDLEQHLRPLHCSDSKREVIYIKDNDKWIKETNDKPILINAIKSIAHENVKQIKAWTSKYPDCIKPTSNKNDTYLRIVSNAMNGLTDEECLSNIKKIISFISKEVVIDKKMVGI